MVTDTGKQLTNHYPLLMMVMKAPSIITPIKTPQSIPKKDQPREKYKTFPTPTKQVMQS